MLAEAGETLIDATVPAVEIENAEVPDLPPADAVTVQLPAKLTGVDTNPDELTGQFVEELDVQVKVTPEIVFPPTSFAVAVN